ncbi:MAG: GAF domain-containing protein [Spirochaetales bacterium]|nr:GAF domain-containing protein [Spirochaetales bacterium]
MTKFNQKFVQVWTKLYGIQPSIGEVLDGIVPAGDLPMWSSHINAALAGEAKSAQLYLLRGAEKVQLELVFIPVNEHAETGNHVIVIAHDVAAVGEPEPRIAKISSRFQAVFASSVDLNSSIQDTQAVYDATLEKLSSTIDFVSGTIQLLEEDSLTVVATFGFAHDDKVVELQFPFDDRFPNYRVVKNGMVLALADIRNDFPHFLTEENRFESGHIRSWMGVPLIAGGEVIGMITLDRTSVDPFDAEDIELATVLANHAGVAISNAQLYQRVQRANETQKMLIRELHHRVKNNMQLVSSLLTLRAADLEESAREAVGEIRTRVQALSAVHDNLIRVGSFDHIVLAPYIRRLVDEIEEGYAPYDSGIRLTVDVPEALYADMDRAIPLGLMVSEMVLNAVKHAFPPDTTGGHGRSDAETPTVSVRIEYKEGQRGVSLAVEDNGVGVEPAAGRENSFGFTLIGTLCEQLGATIEEGPGQGEAATSETRPGTLWRIAIPSLS